MDNHVAIQLQDVDPPPAATATKSNNSNLRHPFRLSALWAKRSHKGPNSNPSSTTTTPVPNAHTSHRYSIPAEDSSSSFPPHTPSSTLSRISRFSCVKNSRRFFREYL